MVYDLAGLLARSPLNTFPLMKYTLFQQWYEDSTVVNRQPSVASFLTIIVSRLTHRTYSYGDSAGLSPDFPFNRFNFYVLSWIAIIIFGCALPDNYQDTFRFVMQQWSKLTQLN